MDASDITERLVELEEADRQRCEVWSRVMGYHRPVSSYNAGKQQEFKDRVCFTEGDTREENLQDV